jgi:hypothetical protein
MRDWIKEFAINFNCILREFFSFFEILSFLFLHTQVADGKKRRLKKVVGLGVCKK